MPGIFGCFTLRKKPKDHSVSPAVPAAHPPDLAKAQVTSLHRESLKSTVFDSVSEIAAVTNRRQSQRVASNKPLVQYVFPRNKSMDKF